MKKIFVIICFSVLCYAPAHATSETGKDGSLIAFDDKTIVDLDNGLMWAQFDNGEDIGWLEAVLLAEDFSLASHNDWRLPSKEELARLMTSKPNSSGLRISPLFHVDSLFLYASETKTCKAAFANLLNASFNWTPKSRTYFGRVLLVRKYTPLVSAKQAK